MKIKIFKDDNIEVLQNMVNEFTSYRVSKLISMTQSNVLSGNKKVITVISLWYEEKEKKTDSNESKK